MLCRCIVILTLTLPALGQNLVVHYKLDETSGTVVSDSSGNGLDAQTMGGTSWMPGFLGGGLDLDFGDTESLLGDGAAAARAAIAASGWLSPD